MGVCLACIRERADEALPLALGAHRRSRAAFGLPAEPPRDPEGLPCRVCVKECLIPDGGTGYCGLRKNAGGRLAGVSPSEGKLSWYHDPLPTNCVGDWVCPGGTGAGYPQYAYREGPEYGYTNLAVFFNACSFNCLFCQNWHFKEQSLAPETTPLESLVADVDERTACICYFGGDPAPQMPFSLKASRLAIEKAEGRILRVCWETNGSSHPGLLDRALELAIKSGGSVKFDLKAWDENLHIALTGATNRRTLENFSRAASRFSERPAPPPVIANSLLVPGYMDAEEIGNIARFIASVNPDVPYSLLAFYPHFYMSDMPLTSRRLAEKCREAALGAGLKRVRIGNVHLLG
jgi:pyruvate formate lyase activating enzyme